MTTLLQLLVCDTKAKTGIWFGKNTSGHLGHWQDYNNRIVCIKHLMIPLVVEKAIQILPDKTTLITLLPKYTATLCYAQPNFF